MLLCSRLESISCERCVHTQDIKQKIDTIKKELYKLSQIENEINYEAIIKFNEEKQRLENEYQDSINYNMKYIKDHIKRQNLYFTKNLDQKLYVKKDLCIEWLNDE